MGPWSRVAGLGVNTPAGGFFHLATWVHVLAGTAATVKAWRDGRRPQSRSFHTGLVLGWGVFNLVEGVVDHRLLGVHHVRDDLGAALS